MQESTGHSSSRRHVCSKTAPLSSKRHAASRKLVPRLDEKEIFLEQPVRQTNTLLTIRYAFELISAPYPTGARPDGPAGEPVLYYEICLFMTSCG